jgi:gamma-glutamyltranspeptidase/glutathione hydrolase
MIHFEKIEGAFQPRDDGKFALSKRGMIATAFPDATMAGVEMFKRGGNAVDAACAAAFALGVCEPQASGIGGQTTAILHTGGKTIAIDGSTRAPSLAHLDRFERDQKSLGYRATTVPSTVAVLGYLNFRYGKLTWSDILAPAIRIAQEGYRITELQHQLQERELERFLEIPSRSGARYFLKDGRKPFQVGDLFIQPDLANLLSYLAENGFRSFYQGLIAHRIQEDMEANDGLLRADDLALIPWPIERRPLRRSYRQMAVSTVPPPAAGRTLLLVLMMLNNIHPRFLRDESPQSYHFLAETFRRAFLYRKQRPFDPNTYYQVPDKVMISRDFARIQALAIRDRIDPDLPMVEPPDEEQDTTHLSVMDSEGNAVGVTQSIELPYGSKAAAEGMGFLYNNYMRAMETTDPSHPYYLRPNAVPWTSVAPAIVFFKNRPWLVLGSPGSERIYSTVSQFLIHMLDKDLPMQTAMEKPRMHCSIGGTVSLEADRFEPEVIRYLKEMGYKINRYGPYDFYFGAVHAVMHCASRDEFHGVAEIRRDGTASGV